MYVGIFHYFNYYVPDFVTVICLVFIFDFSFRVFVLTPLNTISNHLWNLHSWPEIKPWACGVEALTLRIQTTRELLTLGRFKQWELPQRQPLVYKTWHHPTASNNLYRTPHPKNKQDKNPNPVISRQDYHLTQPCPSKKKKKKKTQHKSHPMQSLHKPLDQV